ncbi:hypothetical protein H6P81_014150 [Aristolochia fimbriata]|uniref:Uncharacterized protein n=1 Tax=Aristolochia fimbriata TaxID=158543 RepID=A0AAV7EK05_ARIFI|nr:hypothetical protein H6P81_014150 [Aristolochia fimbriata]
MGTWGAPYMTYTVYDASPPKTQSPMGVCRFRGVSALLFFLLLGSLLISLSQSQRLIHDDAPPRPPIQFQVFKIKKTKPYVLNEGFAKNRRRRRKKMDYWGSRPFSAMLPKGYVPPSGSSSCHNSFPNSINFYCEESTSSTTNP